MIVYHLLEIPYPILYKTDVMSFCPYNSNQFEDSNPASGFGFVRKLKVSLAPRYARNADGIIGAFV
jgi:hypothetical protein